MATHTSRTEIERDTTALLRRMSAVEPRLDSEIVADLGLDSVAVLELCADIEDHFDINVPLNRLAQIRTVADMVARIEGELEERVA
ncbi:MAG: acyl carrier protein [Acidobacteriota bacterium]